MNTIKTLAIALSGLFVSHLAAAEPNRSITITVEYSNNSKEQFTASSFTDPNATFLIKINDKQYVCSSDLSEKGDKVFLDISDLSIIVPGGGSSAGYPAHVFSGGYSVPTGDVVIYKSPAYSIHLSYANETK